jgi:hypothetical protein
LREAKGNGLLPRVNHALAKHPASQPLIVDFDGTLLLRNSTEVYLDSVWPRPLAAFLLAFLDVIKPWRLLPGDNKSWIYSDWIRVVAVTLLLPWSALLWRCRAANAARLYANKRLLLQLALQPAEKASVATFGFRFIVAPLLRAIAPEMKLAVAAPFLSGFKLRRSGKEPVLRRAIGDRGLSESLVITDSQDDADLAAVTAGLIIIECPADAHQRALQDCYIPFYYLHKIKRPKEQHILRKILYQDLVILWISYAFDSASPLLVAAGLTFLQLSFWIIYEIGYWENDVIGSLFEDRPLIREGFAKFKDRFNPDIAWSLALVIGLLGAAVLNLSAATRITAAGLHTPLNVLAIWAVWIAYLCGVRFIYWTYNRVDPISRVYMYPLLQLTKSLGFVVLLPISQIGPALCATLVLTRWIPYIFYRYGRYGFEEMPQALFQLAIFNFLLIVVAFATAGVSSFRQPGSWFVEVWFIFHARKQLSSLIRSFSWLPMRRPTDRAAEKQLAS